MSHYPGPPPPVPEQPEPTPLGQSGAVPYPHEVTCPKCQAKADLDGWCPQCARRRHIEIAVALLIGLPILGYGSCAFGSYPLAFGGLGLCCLGSVVGVVYLAWAITSHPKDRKLR